MKNDDGLQPVNFKYNRVFWKEFRRFVKQKYDLDGSTALKKLVDHAMRTKEIPGVEPRFDYSANTVNDINDKQPTRPTDGQRRTGFSHLRRHGIIIAGDSTEIGQPIIAHE